jgi:hypothetical protein
VHTEFWWGNSGIDWRIILKWIFKKWDEGHDLAQDKDRWEGLVNAIINLQIP